MAIEQYKGKSIDELLAEIDASWQRLMETMSAWPEEDYETKRDAVGWTALDHMAHVTAWERSVVVPLRGGSRHEALGLTDEQFAMMDFDEQNQIIRAQTAAQSYEQVMADAREVHAALVDAVRATDVEYLWKPTTELCADQREEAKSRPFMAILMSDGCEHFDEHREYIEKILAPSA